MTETKNNPWKSGLVFLGLGIIGLILSPILIPVLIIRWFLYKDPHIECNKGNHVYETATPTNGFTHRCKNCGLLS